MRPVRSAPLVGPFADRLLARDLPGLDPVRRAEVVGFTAARVDTLPSVMRVGVLGVAGVLRLLLALPLGDAVVRVAARLPLPVLGDYVRLVRSLGYAYIWETWPDTRVDGAAA